MGESRLSFTRRMSDQEALMWVLEQDPVLRSSFANVTFFDRPVDPDRFRERMAQAVGAIPRLRQRVVDAAGGVLAPEWVEDPMFDIDFHVRRVAAPPPAGEREVLDLAALLSQDPFDRARPLWQFTLVDGLAGGGGAMIQRLHHTIADGEAGVRLSAMFVDLERDAAGPMVEIKEVPVVEEPSRGAVETMRDTVAGGVRVPLGMARSALGGAIGAITDPFGAPARAGEVLETARSVMRQLAVTEPARSPLWAERSLRRRLEVLDVGLDDAKRAARELDGTVNDLFVTGAVGAAGAYHRAQGVDVHELRMAMPVSTRTKGQAGGNSFTPTRMLVPVGISDPVERFRAVQAVLTTTKAERAVGAAAGMAGFLTALPDQVIVRVARQQVGTVDFTTSNVRGAPFELYIGGAKIGHNYPIGPMAGTAFNLTTLSYGGRLDMGCAIDTAAVDEPELLRSCLVDAYDELLAAGGVTVGGSSGRGRA